MSERAIRPSVDAESSKRGGRGADDDDEVNVDVGGRRERWVISSEWVEECE
jgi:hypothetical protein